MKTFSMNEMENIFEIGRAIQLAADEGEIEIFDSKGVFLCALELAIEFEKEYPDTENYYDDLDNFIAEKIKAKFGCEN